MAREKEAGFINVYSHWLSLLSSVLAFQVTTTPYPQDLWAPLPFVDSLAVAPLSLVTQLHIRRVGLLEWVTVNESEGPG